MRHEMMVMAAGAVALAAVGTTVAAPVTFGLPAYFTSSGNTTLSGDTWQSHRFTADKTFSANQIYLFTGGADAASSGVALPVEIYADNAGVPGALLASTSIASPVANAFNVVTLPGGSEVSVQSGSVYHIVVKGPAAVRSRYMSGSLGNVRSFDGSTDANQARVYTTNAGTSWTDSGSTVGITFGLGNSTSHTVVGQPYVGSTSAGPVGTGGTQIGGSAWRGQQFVYDQPTGTLEDLSFRVTVGASAPADDLYVHLLDDENNALFSGVLLDKDEAQNQVSSSFIQSLSIDGTAPTLTNGQTYRMVLSSPGSATGAYSLLANVVDSYAAQPAGDLLGLSFQGSLGFYIQGTSESGVPATWVNKDTAVDAADATFGLTVNVPEPGAMGLIGLGSLAMLKRWRRPSSR